jgi:WD40 repeat protein
VWDVSAGDCLASLEEHSNYVNCVAVLPNGNIISGSFDNTLKIWDVSSGQCLKTLQGNGKSVYCVTALPNGNIISAIDDGSLEVWVSSYLSLSLAEMKKNASVLVQACRTKTSFFASLPDELDRKIIAHTGNTCVHNEKDRDKSVDIFCKQAKNEHNPKN